MLATIQFKTFYPSNTYLKTKIYKTIILLVVLYGCETSFLILGKEHRLRVSENKVLRRIYGPKREVIDNGKNYIMREIVICTLHQTLG
jgi:hypothetical protein